MHNIHSVCLTGRGVLRFPVKYVIHLCSVYLTGRDVCVIGNAGSVHMYLDQPCASWEVADAVEVSGRFLMVHASAGCSNERVARQVKLPLAATVYDEAGTVVCKEGSSFATAPMRAGEVQLFRLAA
jgi:hypothetical protein